jgi:hypothetical protein
MKQSSISRGRQTSFPRASGGNPESLKSLDPPPETCGDDESSVLLRAFDSCLAPISVCENAGAITRFRLSGVKRSLPIPGRRVGSWRSCREATSSQSPCSIRAPRSSSFSPLPENVKIGQRRSQNRGIDSLALRRCHLPRFPREDSTRDECCLQAS